MSGEGGANERSRFPDVDRLNALIDMRRWGEAEVAARAAIARYPAWARGFQLLSMALLHLERLPEAREAVEEASKIAPDDDWNLLQLSWIAQEQKDLTLAREAADRAIEIAPAKAGPHRRLAGVLLQTTSRHPQSRLDPVAALAAADRAVSIDPSSPDSHRLRAQALEALGRRSDAIAAFHEAIRLAPDAHHDVNNLGLLHLRRRPIRAARLLRQSAQLDPTCPNPRNNLTLALHAALDRLTWSMAALGLFALALSWIFGAIERDVVMVLGLLLLLLGLASVWGSIPSGTRRLVAQRSWKIGAVHTSLLGVVLVTDAVIVLASPRTRVVSGGLLVVLGLSRVAVHRVPALFPVARRLGTWTVPRAVPRARRQRNEAS